MAELRWTDEQQRAIDHRAGPLRIIAGAGSGKTATMTEHIVAMIREGYVPADQIVALTFTNAAADELTQRIREALRDPGASVWSGTYHSFGMQIVRDGAAVLGLPANPRLFSPAESWLIIRELLRQGIELEALNVSYGLSRAINDARDFISRCKDELVTPEDVADYIDTIPGEDEVHAAEMRDRWRLYAAYQERCRELGGIDYGDQIALAVQALRMDAGLAADYAARYRVFVVDEYQDTNYAQSVLVEQLARPDYALRIVGDPNQSIYRFRGAAVDNIQRFSEEIPGVADIGLTINFRSHQRILDLANELVGDPDGEDSIRLRAFGERDGPRPVIAEARDFSDETAWIAQTLKAHVDQTPAGEEPPSLSVLVRKRKLLPGIARALDEAGLPYQVYGDRTIFDSEAVQDVIATLEILATPRNQLALVRVLSCPRYGLNHRAIHQLKPLLHERRLLASLGTLVDAPPADLDAAIVAVLKRLRDDLRQILHTTSGLPLEALVREIRNLHAGNLGSFDIEALHQLEQIAGRFAENIIDRSADAFVDYLRAIEELSAEEAEVNSDVEEGAIALLTVHGAKGLEFDVVIIAGANARDFGGQKASLPVVPPPLLHNAHVYPERSAFADREEYEAAVKQIESKLDADEERRLFYVALTRAREHLYFSWAKRHPSRVKETAIYPLLAEVKHLAARVELPPHEAASQATPILDFFRETGAALDPRDDFAGFAEAWREYWQGRPGGQAALAALEEGLARFEAGRNERDQVAARLRDARRARQYQPLPPALYSYSLIDTYERCPRLYLHRYVIGIPAPPVESAFTELGRRFHEALHQAHISKDSDPRAAFLRFFGDVPDVGAPEFGGRQSAASLVRQGYLESGDVDAEVLAAEPEFFLKLGSGPDAPLLYGLIDRIQRRSTGEVEIVDYKTHRHCKSREEVAADLQLPIYVMAAREALGYSPAYATMAFVRHGTWHRFRVDEFDLAGALDTLARAIAGITARHFACTCGGKHCRS